MANGMSAQHARVVERFTALNDGGLTLVELTKDGSDKVRFGVENANGDLIAIVLSGIDPGSEYDVGELGTNDPE